MGRRAIAKSNGVASSIGARAVTEGGDIPGVIGAGAVVEGRHVAGSMRRNAIAARRNAAVLITGFGLYRSCSEGEPHRQDDAHMDKWHIDLLVKPNLEESQRRHTSGRRMCQGRRC